jgi:hypothetical protein
VASGLERVIEEGCAYRAEKHETLRYLNEYVTLDVEMAWIHSEQDLIGLEVRSLKSIFRRVGKICSTISVRSCSPILGGNRSVLAAACKSAPLGFATWSTCAFPPRRPAPLGCAAPTNGLSVS